MSVQPAPALPLQPNRLIGREALCAHVADLLLTDHHRLVTLTGPGGVGKTHLAMCLAEDLARHFPDGAWFVPLEQIGDPDLVLPAIARTIGLHEVPGQAFTDLLTEVLRDRRSLLVLDNLEQVTAAAPEIGRLIARCRHLWILATSRSPLHLRAEREVPVGPLETPPPHEPVSPEEIASAPAVALFIERARAVRPSFTVTAETAPVIAEICRRLDGLPLAIELAASTVNVLSPEALLQRLSDRLRLLTNGAVDLPARQRSLRNAIAWSHDLLTEEDRKVFERLAVFAGEFGIDAAAALVPDDHDAAGSEVLTRLAALVDKSLLYRVDVPDGETRFRMLATIQAFAAERLDTSGNRAETEERLVRWALDLAERSAPELTGPNQAGWLAVLEREHDNLRAALMVAEACCREDGMRLASALWRFWATRGYLSEGFGWLERYTTDSSHIEDRLRARAYVSRANLALDLGDYDDAMHGYGCALELFERLEDDWGVADALNGRGLVHWYRAENAEARTAHERSLAIRRRIGNRHGEANSLTNLANAVKELGEVDLAASLHREALRIRTERGDRGATGFSLINLGDIARRQSRPDEAAAHFQRALDTFREVEDSLGQGYALLGLGHASLLAGDLSAAATHFASALTVRLRLGDRRGVIESIEGIASVAAREQHLAEAVRLLAASEALRAQVSAPLPAADRAALAPLVSSSEASLGPDQARSLRAAGAALTMTAAAEDAARVAQRVAAAGRRPGGLSDREVEVLRLVATGLTNAEVAERLYLSRRTVDAHLRRIYDKLGFSSRLEAIRFATSHGLA